MDDLTPSTATFGTGTLLGETDDVFPALTQAQISENTGFNWYSIECLCMQPKQLEADNETSTDSIKNYMASGTYDIQAVFYLNADGNTSGTYKINGTTLIGITTTTDGWKYGSGTITHDGGWVTSHWEVSSNGIVNINSGAVFFRRI